MQIQGNAAEFSADTDVRYSVKRAIADVAHVPIERVSASITCTSGCAADAGASGQDSQLSSGAGGSVDVNFQVVLVQDASQNQNLSDLTTAPLSELSRKITDVMTQRNPALLLKYFPQVVARTSNNVSGT